MSLAPFTPLLSDQFAFNADIVELGSVSPPLEACVLLSAFGSLVFYRQEATALPVRRAARILVFLFDRRPVCRVWLELPRCLPSVRSALDKGSAVWMLGALLGLRYAVSRGDQKNMITWGASALIYPVLILLLAGFMSYGAAALIVLGSALVVSVRSRLRLIIVCVLGAYLGLTVFVNYFIHRTDFRDIAWSGASFNARVNAAAGIFSNFHWFDPTNDEQLSALYQRLNQNYFVGLAALRIQQDQVNYLYGRSIWEG